MGGRGRCVLPNRYLRCMGFIVLAIGGTYFTRGGLFVANSTSPRIVMKLNIKFNLTILTYIPLFLFLSIIWPYSCFSDPPKTRFTSLLASSFNTGTYYIPTYTSVMKFKQHIILTAIPW